MDPCVAGERDRGMDCVPDANQERESTARQQAPDVAVVARRRIGRRTTSGGRVGRGSDELEEAEKGE